MSAGGETVLVVGGGGREHALCWKLAQSPLVGTVLCAPGNAGTGTETGVENVPVKDDDLPGLVALAKERKVDLVVIGPEKPLVLGLTDELEKAGIAVFGPSKAAAELEGSKAYSKSLMKRAGVPTAAFEIFNNAHAAADWISGRSEQPLVVKADGLAAGKGVIVCDTREEAMDAVRRVLSDREFGAAGARAVVEEKLVGEEASVLAIVDGATIVPLPAAQDHKAALDGDRGPNTGGMGAYTPARLVHERRMQQVVEQVLIPIVHRMQRDDRPFRGILYAGLMFTRRGPMVLEFNVRFGDPEVQPLLMRMSGDLYPLLKAAAAGKLEDAAPPTWDDRAAVCVVMASEGYPGEYETGKTIRGLADAAELPDTKVFHAGTKFGVRDAEGRESIETAGGRVLGVTALGDDVTDAKRRAYEAVRRIRWEGAWCRTDIADKGR
ncbi:phosphoribosylamine--glycine ligase [Alienimonas sp. DA493]|uniref:phosphoribosylamine--glycine ligase n=1 Tax=Alienimonas sp. DA493 TaxID=3373605 RepID=UPI0037540085